MSVFMNEINKTIVTCTAIITLGVAGLASYVTYIYFYAAKTVTRDESRDRLTICLDTVMTKSIESNKAISAKEAKEICG